MAFQLARAMVAPLDGRQWVKRQEQERIVALEQWTTRRAELEAAALAKRQLGFELTLGDAILSIGLNSLGLPAITLTVATAGQTTAAVATTTNAVANTNTVATATAAPNTQAATTQDTAAVAAPATVPTTAAVANTAAADTAAAITVVPASSDTQTVAQNTVANSGSVIINTASGNTVLPTTPLVTVGTSSGTAHVSGSSSVKSSTATGQYTTTEVIFAGGTPITSVMTMGAAATQQPSKHLSPPAIAGAVVGAVGGTAALLLLLVLCIRWRRHVRDNKRISRGGESVRALHTGAAPMMAHNSARYTKLFPQSGAVTVEDDAASSKVAFLPAGATGFLNRAPSNHPRADSPASQIQSDAAAVVAPQAISERLAPTLLAPPSPTVMNPTKAGEVAFLAADASSWLNRNSTVPIAQPPPVAVHDALPAIAATAGSHNTSTPSLASQAGAAPNNGEVNFLPADASGFLNRNSTIGTLPSSPTSALGSLPTATAAASSTPSLPSQVAPAPENAQVTFLPANASGFLNRNSTVAMSSNPTSNKGSLPAPTVTTNSNNGSIRSLPPQNVSAPENGQVTFLPADASGFLNRNSTMPTQESQPLQQAPESSASEPSFQKISGYKVPSQFDNHTSVGSASANFSAPGASLGIPTPTHLTDRNSAGTASNHSINNNSEWFGSDAHDSRYISPAAVAAAMRPPSSVTAMNPGPVSMEGDTSVPSQPISQIPQPYAPPHFGSPATTSSDPTQDLNTSQQDFGRVSFQPGPARATTVTESSPHAPAPQQDYNSPWGSAAPQWPGLENETDSWYQTNSPEVMLSGSGNQVMSWPKPPDVDWDRPRVRPKDAL